MRTQPYFLDTFPKSRRPDYERFHGDARVPVVIVGGGLTGTACALAFAAAGVRTVLLEADRIGGGATCGSFGLLRHDFDASFRETAALHGLRSARHLWQSMRRASLDCAAALRRFGVRCDLGPQDLVELTRDGSKAARDLAKEYAARRAAGLEASWLNARALQRDTGTRADGGLHLKGDAVDPYRAALGLAAAAAARGAAVHERSPVRRVRATRKQVEVQTERGSIAADAVVIATGGPIEDLRALRRHFPAKQSWAVVTEPLPAAVRREVGRRTAALTDTAAPPHLLRWLKEDRVLFAGGERAPLPARTASTALVPAAMELMYELTTIYPAISGVQAGWGWTATSFGSPDNLPVIGRHRNFPHHLFALGHGRHGVGVAWLAARLLVRDFLGEPSRHDDVFGFARVL
jgi:glycine/D-amino acid oxidase-like deaminating enzyme